MRWLPFHAGAEQEVFVSCRKEERCTAGANCGCCTIGDVISRTSFVMLAPLILVLTGCGTAPVPVSQQPPAKPAQTASASEEGVASSGGGNHRKRHRKHGKGGDPNGASNPQHQNVSGNFDFYLLSLSWSPGFCATPAGANDQTQCAPGRKFAFVLHGLWPQYEGHGWPQDCSMENIDQAVIGKMLDIMPSERLIRHEWTKHGTCSGLTSAEYFEEAAEAYHEIKVPAEYKELAAQVSVSPAEIRGKFAALNPAFGEQGFVVKCTNNGRFLTEVHACLTKDVKGRACNADELSQQCKSDAVIMRPVR